MQHLATHLQRLLAYHTLENIGIILLGLGAGVTGLALNQPALVAAGFIGGLYHLVNHSLFKSTLFLGAGSVWFRTGHRDIEKLGGIGKKMPVISLAMLVGLMAMASRCNPSYTTGISTLRTLSVWAVAASSVTKVRV